MNSDQFQDFRRDCWHAKRATGSHINFFYSTERRVTISEEWDRTLFIVQAQFLRFTRHCLSHCQKLKSVPILVSWMRADRDVPIPSSSIPVPGVFAHWIHKSTWQFQLQAQSSMLPGFPKPKRRTCDRIGQERVSLPESVRRIAASRDPTSCAWKKGILIQYLYSS